MVDPTDFEEYGYDANGNRLTLRKRDGSVITYAYDALNRMTSKTLPSTMTGGLYDDRPELPWKFRRNVYYSYDLRGLQTAVRFDTTSGQGILTQYDGFGRITQTTNTLDAKNYVIGSAYDANGNRTSVTHPDNATFGYVYDGLDRADHIKDPSGAWIINPSYDNQGRMNSIYRNGNAIDTLYRYDTVGRLNRLDFLDVVASAQVRWDYTRNPAGQIATEARDNDQYAWLVENTFERNYTTNGLNQYESAGTVDFCYDDNGNLTADGTYVYLYDFENRLVQMRSQVNTDCANLAYTGTWKAEFTYDPLGRLNMVNQGGNATRYVHDGDALIAEYRNSDNALLRRYVHGINAEADDPLVWYEGAGTARADRRYLYADPRGSIVLTADADGNTIAINAYDEYGIPTTSNNGFDISTRGRFRYTGQVWLPELGMYYYKARIYSPTLGRFMQTDPIGYEDQFNLYAYVANDPVNLVDPDGTDGKPASVMDRQMFALRDMGRDCEGRSATCGAMLADAVQIPLAFYGLSGSLRLGSIATWRGAMAYANGWRAGAAAIFRSTGGLRQNVAAQVRKIAKIGHNGAKAKDWRGAILERLGLRRGTGHIPEMRNNMDALRTAAEKLRQNLASHGRSMKKDDRDAVENAIDYAEQLADRMQIVVGK